MTGGSRSLTRHFVRHFLDGGFESVEGADGVRRVMMGVLSALLAVGLFLPRVMAVKYYGARTPQQYVEAIAGDTMMTLAFAMLAAAFAAAVAGAAMFPDETDFRVLTPLPITRAFLFAAKLRAVALYLGIVIAVVTVGLQLPFSAISGGRHAGHPWIVRATAHVSTSLLASAFAALAVTSVQGIIVLGAPARHLRVATVGARTAILCAVVVLVPLAGRLPRQSTRLLTESPVMYLVPPAWFAGLERVLLGSGGGYMSTMAWMALASCAVAAIAIAGCYLTLYRRFDLVILRANVRRSDPAATPVGPRSDRAATWLRHRSDQAATWLRHRSDLARTRLRHRSDTAPGRLRHLDPQTAAIQRFASKTLWRSPLHQVVFLGLTACGFGWVLNDLLGAGLAGWVGNGGVPPPALVDAVAAAPFVLILAGVTGLRSALLLPHDARANWVFRMNDRDEQRSGQLDAVERLLVRLVIVPVLVCTLPLGVTALGPLNALAVTAIALCCGLLLVEVLVRNWRRIPFTCGYIPGRRHVAETLLIALVAFVFFTGIGRAAFAFSRVHPSRLLMTLGLLLMILAAARRFRETSWGRAPLMFDDDPPEMTAPLQLS